MINFWVIYSIIFYLNKTYKISDKYFPSFFTWTKHIKLMLNIFHNFLLEQTIKNHLQMIKNHI